MTDIRIEVDLRHPVGRVWLAITDPRLLAQWFGETAPAIGAGVRFRIRPMEPPAVDATLTGEVLEFDEPRRLVMRWAGSDRRTVVAYDLVARPDGCRLAFQEFPEAGTWQPDERVHRRAAYEQALRGRLPAVLDWLAFREVEFTPAAPVPATEPEPAAPHRSRPVVRRLAGAGAGVLVAGVIITVVLAGRGDGDPGPAQPPPAASGLVSATPPATSPPTRSPARAARPARTPATSAPPTTGAAGTTGAGGRGAPALAASYRTLSNRLFGYTGEVAVANTGRATATRWTVAITLPAGATVASAEGAEFTQDGREATFTGPAVAAGTTVRFEFEVAGDARLSPKRPDDCLIDGDPCGGL